MAIGKDDVKQTRLVTEVPVTDVTKTAKSRQALSDFNVAIAIIGVAWLVLFALIWSLREFNV